ncbi:MAG: MoxR family ATPase [Gammaproteobacteria bacterium]|jgi:MoxR-like ATPase|nr:MoxR family ATPase [Gammaproteobacteria bacterium]
MNDVVAGSVITMDSIQPKLAELRDSIGKILIGQHKVIDQVLIALFANGHVLIEGVPGLGKTLLVRTLAACFNGSFKRIQFTPDLMPADVTGHTIFNMKDGDFRFRKGPVFTNLLLADEINRSPAKTQAALLEVMQEKQVTISGVARELPRPFMVLATQNPIEQEGTYPLPEAELDRFLMKIFIDFPDYEDEIKLTRLVCNANMDDPLLNANIAPLFNESDIVQIQQLMTQIVVDEQIVNYSVRLVRATRESAAIVQGAGPRASIGLVRCARARAMLSGRNFVLPDDIKAVTLPVMRHRISLSADVEIDGLTPDQVLSKILQSVEAPRQ